MLDSVQVVAFMRECGYAGDCLGDTSLCASGAEFRAAEILLGHKASKANVILAFAGLHRYLMSGCNSYSHAAANTDRVRLAKRENSDPRLDRAYVRLERRAEREEAQALEQMLSPNPASVLYEKIAALAGIPASTALVLSQTIRSVRHMRSVMDRHAQGRSGMAAGVPALYNNLVTELKEHGINA